MSSSFLFLTIFCFFTCVAARPRIYRQTGSSPCPVKEQLNSPGTITSPGHPGPYPKNSTCTWVIAAPKDAFVWLEFLSLDIKSGPSCGAPRCKCDYVQIREAKKTLPRIIEKFCEGHLPGGVIRTSSSRVRVQFGSDMTDEGTGFSLKYWFVVPTTSPPIAQNTTTTLPSLVTSEVATQASKVTNMTPVNVVPVVTTQETTQQTTTISPPLIIDGPTKPVSTPPKQVYSGTPTTEFNYGFNPAPSGTSISRPIKARSTPLKDEPRPALKDNNSGNTRSNVTVPVVLFVENKEAAKKAEEEADPPDAIVLGPAIPIILIFIGVVLAIAWWKLRGDHKERLRYYKEQIRYEEISKRKRLFKKKQSMKEIRTKRLYSDMTRSWQGRSQTAPSPLSGRPRRTFAGRLLELAEKPVSYIKTPRSSRPSSMVLQEQGTPLVVMRQKKDRPTENTSHLDPGNRPPSRPASVLLRDALNMIFGATAAEPSDSANETPKDSGSGSTSKRGSKRVSFYDALVEKMAEVKEAEDEPSKKKDEKNNLAPLSIPHIMIRQPSYDSGDDLEIHRRSPSPKSSSISEEKDKSVADETKESESKKERGSHEETGKKPPKNDQQDAAPDSKRPRSFDKKLVEKLEGLQREGDERERDSEERDELEEPTPPPAPHQTPDPRDSASTSPTGKVMNCNELEEFLQNLDKEMKEQEQP